MITEKDIEKCRFFTTTGGDIWKTKKVRTIMEVDLENCENSRVETCRIGEQSAERFVPIAMPQIARAIGPAQPIRVVRKKKSKKHNIKPTGQGKSKRGTRNGKPPSSRYLGVTVHQGKSRPSYYAQSSRDGKWKGLGVHKVEELAAAAVQEYIGNKEEAKRLREIARQKTNTAIEQPKENTGQVKFLCAGCGAEYLQKPEQCVKCNSGAFETIQAGPKRK